MKAHPVTDLNTVMGFFPRDLAQAGIQFTSGAPGVVSGAIAVVFIGYQTEEPKAFDGAGGGRQTTYIANIQIYHRSAEPDPNDAQTNFDAIMVSLLDLFRTDPQMGQAHDGPIINMAYEHLTVDYGEPEQAADDSGALLTWATISFPVLEWNQVT
jgi:hypothetical protein